MVSSLRYFKIFGWTFCYYRKTRPITAKDFDF